jgi:hypothetical protein
MVPSFLAQTGLSSHCTGTGYRSLDPSSKPQEVNADAVVLPNWRSGTELGAYCPYLALYILNSSKCIYNLEYFIQTTSDKNEMKLGLRNYAVVMQVENRRIQFNK